MPKCLYKGCKSNTNFRSSSIRFIPFPKPHRNRYLTQKWMSLCDLDFDVTKINRNSYVCTKHFVGNCGPTSKFPDPIGKKSGEIDKIDIDDVAVWEEISSSTSSFPGEAQVELLSMDKVFEEKVQTIINDHDYCSTGKINHKSPTERDILSAPKRKCARNLFNVNLKSNMRNKEPLIIPRNRTYFSYSTMSSSSHKNNFKFLTGLSHEHFLALYNFLDPNVMPQLKYGYKKKTPKKKIATISDKEKLFITLVRLRRGFTLRELSIFFGISVSWIGDIFFTWVQFIYLQTVSCRGILFQSCRNIPLKKTPKCFRKFPGLTLILDATEMAIQVPKNFKRQGNTHSSYKHDNTVKFLVGISTNGMISFISEGYEGSISDRQLFNDCDLKYFLKPNDIIMADRGFNINDLTDELGVKLYIPPFLCGRDKFTSVEEVTTKFIAKARIHVERAIGRMKKFRIINRGRISILLLPILSAIVYVISFLINFQGKLVS